MRSTRKFITLAACLTLSLSTLALRLPASHAQLLASISGASATVEIYQLVAVDGVTVSVNGRPARLGTDYRPNDVVRVTSGSVGSLVISRFATGQVPGVDTFPAFAASGLDFQAIWGGDE